MSTEPKTRRPLESASDIELITRISRWHDEEAFRELVHRYAKLVMGVCTRVLGNAHEAEDAFQETFLTVFHKAPTLWVQKTISSWLYGVAYRTARRIAFKRTRRREEPLIVELPSQEDVLTQICARHEQLVFDEELDLLPEKYRLPLVLHHLEGKTAREVSAELGTTLRSVEGCLRRGKQHLRMALSRRGVTLTGAIVAVLAAQRSIKAETLRLLVDSVVNTSRPGPAAAAGDCTESASIEWWPLQETLLMYRCIWTSVAVVVLVILLAGGTSYRSTAAGPTTTAPAARTSSSLQASLPEEFKLLGGTLRVTDGGLESVTVVANSPEQLALGEPARPEQSAAYFVGLLLHPEVQGELKLSRHQRRQIGDARVVSYRFGGKTYGPKNRLWSILSVEQRTRLSQLERQYVDYTRLSSLLRLHQDVSGDLGLSKGQIESVREIESDTLRRINDDLRKIQSDGKKPDLEAMVELNRRSLQLHRDARERVLKVLTAAQTKRWATMLGKPFDVATIVNRNPFDSRRKHSDD